MAKSYGNLAERLSVSLSELIILERVNDLSDPSVEIKKEQILNIIGNATGQWIDVFNDKKLSSISSIIDDTEFLSKMDTIFKNEIKLYYGEHAKKVDSFLAEKKKEYRINSTTIPESLLTPGKKTFILPGGKTVSCSSFGYYRLDPQNLKKELEDLKAEKEKEIAQKSMELNRRIRETKDNNKRKSIIIRIIVNIILIIFFISAYADSEYSPLIMIAITTAIIWGTFISKLRNDDF